MSSAHTQSNGFHHDGLEINHYRPERYQTDRVSLPKAYLCCAVFLATVLVLGLAIGLVFSVNKKSNCTMVTSKSESQGTTPRIPITTLPPLYWTQPTDLAKDPENVTTSCTSSECILHAAKLLHGINPSVDPCDDFYAFACGRRNEETVVTSAYKSGDFRDQQSRINSRVKDILNSGGYDTESALAKAVRMYEVCLSQGDDVSSMKRALEDISGGWPLAVGRSWELSHRITNFNDLLPILIKLNQYRQNGFLFTLGVLPDKKNTSRNLPVLIQPDRTKLLPLKKGFLFELGLARMLSNLANSITKSSTTDLSALADTRDILMLNELIYNAIKPEDPKKVDYRVLTFAKLEELTGNNIKWLDYINGVFDGIRPQKFKSTDVIGVTGLDYFKEIGQSLQTQFHKRSSIGKAIVNLEVLRMLLMTSKHSTHKSYRSSTESLIEFLSSPPRIPDDVSLERKFFCERTAGEWFLYALARQYAERHMNVTAAVQVSKEMTSYILNSFEDRLHTLDWLDTQARTGAVDKVRQMKRNYNFPDWVNDAENVKRYYNEFTIENDHIRNLLNYLKFMMKKSFRQINVAVKGTGILSEWLMAPLTVNAFYAPSENSLTLLQAILQPPVFGADRLKVMNFASLGGVIGHEIAHGFESAGQQYDGQGNLADWMGRTSRNRYDAREACFHQQYSQYALTSEDVPGMKVQLKVNASKTADEDVADTAGIQHSYWAYKKWESDHGVEVLPNSLRQFSNDQVFFISYAHAWCTKYNYYSDDLEEIIVDDEHSPERFRVLGSLRNFKEFANVFQCRDHHRMNPNKRCSMW